MKGRIPSFLSKINFKLKNSNPLEKTWKKKKAKIMLTKIKLKYKTMFSRKSFSLNFFP